MREWLNEHPRVRRWGLIMLVVLIGAGLRVLMATDMRVDYDEDEYLITAAVIRQEMEEGDYDDITNIEKNYEHPPLSKIVYATALEEEEVDDFPTQFARFGRQPLPEDSLEQARLVAVALGALSILVVAVWSRLAALVLALQSLHVHFTSTAYLEAVPTLFATLAVLFYSQAFERGWPGDGQPHRPRRRMVFLLLSAAALGIAVAGKYPYALVGVAMLLHALFIHRRYLLRAGVWLAGWGLVSLLVFFIFNPYIWFDPVERLASQVDYHQDYADNYEAKNPEMVAGLKFISQMAIPHQHLHHLLEPHVIFPFAILDVIFLIGVLPGSLILLRQRSVVGWWLVVGLLFLLVWDVQHIQHKMLIIIPYCIASAAGWRWIVQRAWRYFRQPPAGRGQSAELWQGAAS
jgi:hypothetical protein